MLVLSKKELQNVVTACHEFDDGSSMAAAVRQLSRLQRDCGHVRQLWHGRLLPCATPGCKEGPDDDVVVVAFAKPPAFERAPWGDHFAWAPVPSTKNGE